MNDTRDTDPTELENEVPSLSIPADADLPGVSAIPDSVLSAIFGELRGMRAEIAAAHVDKEWRPKWVDEILSFTERVVALEEWRRQRDFACRDCPRLKALSEREG